MIKLIASDMDGTLLSSHVGISEFNKEAIEAAKSQGIEFMVATGRSYTEAYPVLKEAGIECSMILGNGAQIVDATGQVIHTAKLDSSDVYDIMSILEEAGLYFELVTSDGVYTNSLHARIEKFAIFLAETIPHLTFKMAIAMASTQLKMLPVKHIEDYHLLIENSEVDILKVISFSDEGSNRFEGVLDRLNQNPSLCVTSSYANNIEINHATATKGQALAYVATQKGIDLKDVLAIGDNFNDVSMLKEAGVSFAMGNAEEKVKKVAKYETDTNFNHGVGKAILRAIDENL